MEKITREELLRLKKERMRLEEERKLEKEIEEEKAVIKKNKKLNDYEKFMIRLFKKFKKK